MTTLNITVETQNEKQIKAIKSFFSALDINFKIKKDKETFFKEIDEALLQVKNGEVHTIDLDTIWK